MTDYSELIKRLERPNEDLKHSEYGCNNGSLDDTNAIDEMSECVRSITKTSNGGGVLESDYL